MWLGGIDAKHQEKKSKLEAHLRSAFVCIERRHLQPKRLFLYPLLDNTNIPD
jgi:hypothetical protein